MTCAYCAASFEEDRAQPTCQACPLSSGCKAVRCPNCGYENPAVPPWVASLGNLMRKVAKR